MATSHLPFSPIRSRLAASYHLHIFIPPLPSFPKNSPRCYRLLSTEPSPGPQHRDSGPPPGFNIAGHKNVNSRSDASPAASNSGQSIPSSESGTQWYDNPDFTISTFSELPSKNFGVNQHMIINEEFKEALRQILWQFKAPIRYAFAYGSGVFPQSNRSAFPAESSHPAAPQAIQTGQGNSGKMIDFIFGVSYSQHWHALNLNQHRDHYSGLGSLGSYIVSQIQERWGAGVYFNPYVTVNGTLIKYGVVNIDTLCKDLSDWDSLYLAGRLQKPVKILRDHPKVRLANQVNLLSAVRVALLLLPPTFTEQQLYSTIAGISYMGDPRMSFATEDPRKVNNIVSSQMTNFRRLYAPLIETLPNVAFNDPQCSSLDWVDNPEVDARLAQDMDPLKRGNMVRRLPQSFREKLYFQFQSRYQIPRVEFDNMMEKNNDEDPERVHRRVGGTFEQRIAADEHLKDEATKSIRKTIAWPSMSQSVKSLFTAGLGKGWRYVREKQQKYASAKQETKEDAPSGSKKE
ncbi:hypothetical protein RJZ56_000499 [Blastomyces dermatitidis]|uniref:Phosphatidate cytidylyltransferase, mitochondrial n=1 Tax=Ajellomyces dermatitidis (strain ATCC 18188 / CBS 674.68) TaxID=653446 RepID=F2T9V0_AJEDA|nr:mitochondrial import protein mmp37 [Blastomyces dermatitidis ATCC 18188]EQL34377.1 hypothetical protein BDFG_03734 [Blastomyces dermatitidis ATCC 26199]